MPDLTPLFEFSRTHCVAICTVLVPANLLATTYTLFLIGFRSRITPLWLSATIASLLALVMISHVLTWFMVGVVMPPTYILLILGSVCLGVNAWAIVYPASLRRLLNYLTRLLQRLVFKRWVSQASE